jgi:16S rRNA (uracil1498-N3)-methyltransferase
MDQRASIPRFYVPDLPRAAGSTVALPPGEGHHAAHVLRLRAGTAVELFDGRGARATGRVAEVRRREVSVSVDAIAALEARPGPLVHLALATPKGNRLDWLLEKATELGAASLQPVIFERSVAGAARSTRAKRERLLAHCIAAAKQAGTDYLPDLADPVPLADLLARPSEAVRIVGDLGEGALPLADALGARLGWGEVLILVGPEGGLTAVERGRVLAAGFVPVRIGRTTLRIETAAVALLASVMALGG